MPGPGAPDAARTAHTRAAPQRPRAPAAAAAGAVQARAALRPRRRARRDAHLVVGRDVVLAVLVETAPGAPVCGRDDFGEDAVGVLSDRRHLRDALKRGASACGGAEDCGCRESELVLWGVRPLGCILKDREA